ncbi:MAG: ubiquitin-activating E1 FCCH domain-containing protein [Brevundimonas sp.]
MASQLIHRTIRRLRSLGARLRHDRRGNVAIIFALSLPAIVMLTLGGVDLHRITTARSQLQDALDAATLAAARSSSTESKDLKAIALATLRANLQDTEIEPLQDADVDVTINTGNVIVATAQAQVKTLVANIVLPPYGQLLDETLPINVRSDVNRSARNLEVALVLDITGSMAGTRLSDLKTASKDLIDLVVQTEQSLFYSKVALVPYSMGVNVGEEYADRTRGPLTGPTNISSADWAAAASVNVSSISRANPAVVTANGHGLVTGDYVWLAGVSRMTDLNDRVFQITAVNTNTFRLNGVNTSGYSRTGTGGKVTKCLLSNCNVVVTSSSHALNDGEYAKITDVVGMTDLNATWSVTRLSNDKFWVPLLGPPTNAYSRGGRAQCGRDGCAIRLFINQAGALRELPSSTCVSERAGTHAFKDTAPGTGSWVGRNYPNTNGSNANRCLSSTIYPLSSDITKLKNQVDGYSAAGSTAGQIGIGWGWYMVSPNFGGIWPAASVPGPVNARETLKAVVIMTDGEFNNPYCGGVISKDAIDNGSAGDVNYQINCSATEGDPFTQSVQMCAAMKAAGVVVYTVGFDLSTNRGKDTKVDTAIEVMETCATSKDKHFFQPVNGAGLKDAFRSIGQDISRLRISR